MKSVHYPRLVLVVLVFLLGSAAGGPATIYTHSELQQCGGWVSKGPHFAYDGKGTIYTLNACRGKGAGLLREDDAPFEDEADVAIAQLSNRTTAATNTSRRRLDPVGGQVIVMKKSSDGGKTWGGFQVISGAHSGYAGAKCIYDTKRNQLVTQFMRYPSGESSKTKGARLFQR